MASYRIVNARILLPEGLVEKADVSVHDGIFDLTSRAGTEIDARGMILLPGIVDLHGDAFERQLMPRPGVFFADELALLDTDRQLCANGITTAYHALTWSWEPGLRGTVRAKSFVETLDRLRPNLACDTKLHLRWEVFNIDETANAIAWLESGRIGLFAFNDHTPGMLSGERGFANRAKTVERTGLSVEEFEDLLQKVGSRAAEVDASNAAIASAARNAGVAMASHDDASPDVRSRFRDLGCRISEFPMTRETAAAARDAGEHVMMGAPNVVRGGSHLSLVSAESLVRADFCDVLASDYYYPALLQAPWRLAGGSPEALTRLWPLVSSNPARAAGLTDRGTIASGQRADFILVDTSNRLPRVAATFVSGRAVYDSGWAAAHAA